MTVLNQKLKSEPEAEFRIILERLELPYEQSVADFFRTYRINSSFPEAPKAEDDRRQVLDPWQEWSDKQRVTFTRVAGPTMLKYGLASPSAFHRPVGLEPVFASKE